MPETRHRTTSIVFLAGGLGLAFAYFVGFILWDREPRWVEIVVIAVLILVGILTADLRGPRDPVR